MPTVNVKQWDFDGWFNQMFRWDRGLTKHDVGLFLDEQLILILQCLLANRESQRERERERKARPENLRPNRRNPNYFSIKFNYLMVLISWLDSFYKLIIVNCGLLIELYI